MSTSGFSLFFTSVAPNVVDTPHPNRCVCQHGPDFPHCSLLLCNPSMCNHTVSVCVYVCVHRTHKEKACFDFMQMLHHKNLYSPPRSSLCVLTLDQQPMFEALWFGRHTDRGAFNRRSVRNVGRAAEVSRSMGTLKSF